MARKTVARWFVAVLAAAFLMLGVVQVVGGQPLGWAAMIAAVSMGAGLLLAGRKISWGQLLISGGAVTGVTWLFSMALGWLGRGYDFVYGGWGAAIGVTIASFLMERSDRHAERWHEKHTETTHPNDDEQGLGPGDVSPPQGGPRGDGKS
ncbi:hypothetical protein [Kocuria rosea]|uniref:Uncharacterized protein n=1 Tax=Kocuria rosea TaxID=1275 RepID=A0A4R5YN50_KOCRO|nr:hypothetical protein [Kocuria rosea]TDL46498.1 hypothetical protein E2R59_00285 [Kocuria rosea]